MRPKRSSKDLNIRKEAVLSRDRRYRYTLTREWQPAQGLVNFVMLNPSTADAYDDDATIRRCVGFAREWGYGGIVVTNLYAFRATQPADLFAADDPVGPENEGHLRRVAAEAAVVVCAWGDHGRKNKRGHNVAGLLRGGQVNLNYLRLTRFGQPNHPVRLPYGLSPQPWVEKP